MKLTERQFEIDVEAVKDPGEGILKVMMSPVAKKLPDGSKAKS